MYIKNRKFATIYRLILIILGVYGLYLNFTGGRIDAVSLLSFYTIQSNIVVLIFFAWLVVRSWRRRDDQTPSLWYYTVKGGVTVCIALTFIVFHFVLRPTLFAMGGYVSSGANILVHYVVPLMTIGDWLLFDRKGGFRRLDPLKWLVIPLAYFIFALVRAPFGSLAGMNSRYPYFFIDIDKYGVGQVALNVALFAVGFAALGYLLYLIDRGLHKFDKT
jgi:hypothetical protein